MNKGTWCKTAGVSILKSTLREKLLSKKQTRKKSRHSYLNGTLCKRPHVCGEFTQFNCEKQLCGNDADNGWSPLLSLTLLAK